MSEMQPSPSPRPHPPRPGEVQQTPTSLPPGWYPDPAGVTRWWSGTAWTEHAAPQQAPPQPYGYSGPVPVQPNVKQGRDRSQYVRQQKGHSIIKHLLLGWVLAWIPTIYYAISPNHYFHA